MSEHDAVSDHSQATHAWLLDNLPIFSSLLSTLEGQEGSLKGLVSLYTLCRHPRSTRSLEAE